MKDKDYVDLADVYSDQVITEGAQSGGYNSGKDEKKWGSYRSKLKKSNPDLARQRAQTKKEKGIKLTDADKEALGDNKSKKFKVKEGAAEDANNARWASERLRELEPAELVEFINEAMPKFLKTNFNPEDYDEIKSKLYSAAELLNDPYGPGGQEYDAGNGGDVGNMPGGDDRSWQDNPGVYPPGYN